MLKPGGILPFAGVCCQVLKVEEEEFCYIPMGGSLPKANQRVVAFGGAMALVHPSTGYHICRALAAAGPCATTIAQQVPSCRCWQPMTCRHPQASPDAVYTAARGMVNGG